MKIMHKRQSVYMKTFIVLSPFLQINEGNDDSKTDRKSRGNKKSIKINKNDNILTTLPVNYISCE